MLVVTLTNVTGNSRVSLSGGSSGGSVIPDQPTGYSYTVPATSNSVSYSLGFTIFVGDSAVWSCTPAPPSSNNNSQLLEQTRQTFSKVAAQTSSQAMGEAASGAIGDAFGDGGATAFGDGTFRTSFAALENAKNADGGPDKKRDPFEAFGALGYAKASSLKAPPLIRSPWHVWIDGHFTGFEDKNLTSFDGWHDNITGGASYRFSQNFLAGVLVGYENFNYGMSAAGTPISLKGDGTSGGGYFGWKFFDKLRLDGMLTYGRINYAAAAGPVTGSFDADRITGMTKLSGHYGFGTFYVDPSVMMTIASEHQGGFIDTAATSHGTFDFTVGRASTGATIGKPFAWGECVVTPSFGAFADYRFGNETTAALSVVPTFSNGFSSHVTGGLSVANSYGVTASATGEYGGLGDQLQYWRAKGSLGVKF